MASYCYTRRRITLLWHRIVISGHKLLDLFIALHICIALPASRKMSFILHVSATLFRYNVQQFVFLRFMKTNVLHG